MGACCEAGDDMRPAVTRDQSHTLSKKDILAAAATPANEQIKVEYFPGKYGRVDPIIQLLAYKQANYEFVGVNFAQWAVRKAAGQTGGLPIVTVDGQKYQETKAILRMLGIKYGYYNPTDWKAAGVIDMIVDTQSEVFDAAAKIVLFTPDEQKEAEIDKLCEGLLPKFLGILENQLSRNNGSQFLIGDEITIADFVVASFAFNMLKNDSCILSPKFVRCAMSFPVFGAYTIRLRSELSSHLNSRPSSDF